MDPTRLMKLPATITPIAAGGVDEYNDDELEPGTPIDTVCWFEQQQRSENLRDDTTEATFAVYLPPDTTLNPADQIAVEDFTFEVIGPPWTAIDPRTTFATHVEATARRIT